MATLTLAEWKASCHREERDAIKFKHMDNKCIFFRQSLLEGIYIVAFSCSQEKGCKELCKKWKKRAWKKFKPRLLSQREHQTVVLEKMLERFERRKFPNLFNFLMSRFDGVYWQLKGKLLAFTPQNLSSNCAVFPNAMTRNWQKLQLCITNTLQATNTSKLGHTGL